MSGETAIPVADVIASGLQDDLAAEIAEAVEVDVYRGIEGNGDVHRGLRLVSRLLIDTQRVRVDLTEYFTDGQPIPTVVVGTKEYCHKGGYNYLPFSAILELPFESGGGHHVATYHVSGT